MPLMIHVWRMVTENCVWLKILKCCVWRLILKHCVWRVISKHCAWRQPDGTFQNHASNVIFCDHASDVQYESGYVGLLFEPQNIFYAPLTPYPPNPHPAINNDRSLTSNDNREWNSTLFYLFFSGLFNSIQKRQNLLVKMYVLYTCI